MIFRQAIASNNRLELTAALRESMRPRSSSVSLDAQNY